VGPGCPVWSLSRKGPRPGRRALVLSGGPYLAVFLTARMQCLVYALQQERTQSILRSIKIARRRRKTLTNTRRFFALISQLGFRMRVLLPKRVHRHFQYCAISSPKKDSHRAPKFVVKPYTAYFLRLYCRREVSDIRLGNSRARAQGHLTLEVTSRYSYKEC